MSVCLYVAWAQIHTETHMHTHLSTHLKHNASGLEPLLRDISMPDCLKGRNVTSINLWMCIQVCAQHWRIKQGTVANIYVCLKGWPEPRMKYMQHMSTWPSAVKLPAKALYSSGQPYVYVCLRGWCVLMLRLPFILHHWMPIMAFINT
jgi:hypothetical protein